MIVRKSERRYGRLPAAAFNNLPDEVPTYRWDAPDEPTTDAWEHYELWERVVETLYALHAYFMIEGGSR